MLYRKSHDGGRDMLLYRKLLLGGGASDRKRGTGPGATYDTAGGWNRNPGAEATAHRNDSPDTRLTTHNTSAAGSPSGCSR